MFELSYQFTEILVDIVSRFRTPHPGPGPMAAIPPLEQSSQPLVLSSYLCLVESYKVSQHIKAWIEVQSKMGMFTSDEHFPIQLPSLMVGFFKLPTCSSMKGAGRSWWGYRCHHCCLTLMSTACMSQQRKTWWQGGSLWCWMHWGPSCHGPLDFGLGLDLKFRLNSFVTH